MTYKVAYDAGHGKYTAGKRSPSGVMEEREWFFNDEVARAFAKELGTYKGVELHRMDDPTGKRDVPLSERTNKANKLKASLYISFHHNALYDNKWGDHTGVETYYFKGSKNGQKLAAEVQKAIVKVYGLRDRGIKTNNLHITRETNMTAVLVEGGFMDSTNDIKKLRDKKVLRDAGKAIAKVVANYLGLTKAKEEKPVQPPKTNAKPTPNKPSTTKPKKKTFEQMVQEVIDGKHGNGHENRRKSLGVSKTEYEKIRAEVNKRLTGKSKPTVSKPKPKPKPKSYKRGDKVKIKKSARFYSTGQPIPSRYKGVTYTVQQVGTKKVLIKELYSWVNTSDLE